jgi:hypothetical protein
MQEHRLMQQSRFWWKSRPSGRRKAQENWALVSEKYRQDTDRDRLPTIDWSMREKAIEV